MSLTKRTEIMLDDERYERLRRHAESSGTSIAALIRGAIDRAYPAVSQERRRAAAGFLSAVRREEPAVEQEEWAVLKDRMLEEKAKLAGSDE